MNPQGRSTRKIHCPQCHAELVWNPENPYRPFCSERCKLIDFGQWANEGYRIPQAERDDGTQEDDEA